MTAPYDPKATRRRKDAARDSTLNRVAEQLEAEMRRDRDMGGEGVIEDPQGRPDFTPEEYTMLKILERRAKARSARSTLRST